MEFYANGIKSGFHECSQNLRKQIREEFSDPSRWRVEYGEASSAYPDPSRHFTFV